MLISHILEKGVLQNLVEPCLCPYSVTFLLYSLPNPAKVKGRCWWTLVEDISVAQKIRKQQNVSWATLRVRDTPFKLVHAHLFCLNPSLFLHQEVNE